MLFTRQDIVRQIPSLLEIKLPFCVYLYLNSFLLTLYQENRVFLEASSLNSQKHTSSYRKKFVVGYCLTLWRKEDIVLYRLFI